MPALPDYLAPGLSVVFCGMAAGPESARRGRYYAGRGNKFWKTLHAVGLTSVLLGPDEDFRLPEFGIGLTDVVKDDSGLDAQLPASAFEPGKVRAVAALWRPAILAFNGKSAARHVLGLRRNPAIGRHHVEGLPPVWVLPSTSGSASGFWSIAPWQAIAVDIATAQPEPGLV